jgi:hypothetical protein
MQLSFSIVRLASDKPYSPAQLSSPSLILLIACYSKQAITLMIYEWVEEEREVEQLLSSRTVSALSALASN